MGIKDLGLLVKVVTVWFKSFEKNLGFKSDIKWNNVILITLYHVLCVYLSINYAFRAKWQTFVIAFVLYIVSGFGVTVGAHRFWCHRTFKATLPLRITTLICFSCAGHNSLVEWVRDHRVHHKYSDTDADPHNVNRGLFFSHIGWLMMSKHRDVIKQGKKIDMTDLLDDPYVRFHEKYFGWSKLVFCYGLPMAIFMGLGEDWQTAAAWVLIRHVTLLHATFCVNSLAHTFGYKPYNKDLKPTENRFVATVTFGEGWHNYHHAFPYDYKAAEFGDFLNWGTASIEMFRKLGQIYDLKEATPEMIAAMTAK